MSPVDLLEFYHLETNPGVTKINHKTFLQICPALVYQLDQRSCYKITNNEKDIKEIHLGITDFYFVYNLNQPYMLFYKICLQEQSNCSSLKD